MVITKNALKKCRNIIILIAFCVIMAIPSGEASATAIDQWPQMMLDHINSGVILVIRDNLTPNDGNNYLYTFVLGTGHMNADGSYTAASPSVVTNFANAVKVFCGFAVIIITVMKYFQMLEKEHDPQESLYKMASELFIVAAIIMNIDLILQAIVELGLWIVNVAISLGDLDGEIKGVITLEMLSGASSGNLLWWLQCVTTLFVPWIMTSLLQIVAQFTAFSLLIELGIRKAFAPIACCDIYSEGLRSPGVRYLKRFLATFIKIAICILVCYIGQTLIGASLVDNINEYQALNMDIFQYLFRVIAINFTVIGVMNKTGEYANDIVGV